MGQKCQHLAQIDHKCTCWPNLAIFGPKILILTGGSKLFGTHVMEKQQTPCSHCFLVGHGTKWPKNADIWPKMSVLGQIWPFFGQKSIFRGDEVKLFVLAYDHLGVLNNMQPSWDNFEPVWGVHAKKRPKIPYLGRMPSCEFKMAKTTFLSSCLIFATVQAH